MLVDELYVDRGHLHKKRTRRMHGFAYLAGFSVIRCLLSCCRGQ